jgi:hypothetical protein
METNYKQITVCIVAIIAVFYLSGNYFIRQENDRMLKLQINGAIQSITYDDKGYPSITVLDTSYYLNGSWLEPGFILNVGDSVKKLRNKHQFEFYLKRFNKYKIFE